jgi:polar amino acid transport system substrate-binding protein
MKTPLPNLLLLTFFLFYPLLANAAEPVQIAVDSGNPPFMYEENGHAVGLYPVLLKAVFKQMGVPVQIGTYPWKRTLHLGEAGLAGIGGIYKNAERLKIYDYSEPIFQEKIVLFMNRKTRFAYHSISDLKGKHVGAILGWSYGQQFDEARRNQLFTIDAVPSDRMNFRKLERGRLDCLIAIDMAGRWIIEKEHLQRLIVAARQPVAINSTYLVFAKKRHQRKLLNTFNATLKAMRADRSYERIIAGFTMVTVK